MDYGKKVQIHNFVMVKYKVDNTSFIKVSSVNGDWSVSYREDNIMFLTLDMAEEKSYEALYNLFISIYGTCQIVDSEYTKDVFDAMNRYFESLKAEKKSVSDDEDSKIIDEERKMYEMKKETENVKDDRRDTQIEGGNG